MPNHDDERATYTGGNSPLRTFCGLVLIVCGGVIAFHVLQNVYNLLTSDADILLVQKLTPKDALSRSFVAAQQRIELPESVYMIGAYGVLSMMLLISAGIGNCLIRAGVSLLQPDFTKLIQSFRSELRRSR